MPNRNIGLCFCPDANRINARQRDEYMNQLEQWEKKDVIFFNMSESAAVEVKKGGSSNRHKKLSTFRPFTLTYADSPQERIELKQIAMILFGEWPVNENEFGDVELVFNCKKYSNILLKEDNDILSKKDVLKSKFGVKVYRTSEAVELVKSRIQTRVRYAKWVSKLKGEILPDWVGKD